MKLNNPSPIPIVVIWTFFLFSFT